MRAKRFAWCIVQSTSASPREPNAVAWASPCGLRQHLPFVFFEYGYAGVMASTLRERTVLPPDDPSDMVRLARGLARVTAPAQARLVGPDGSQIDIPVE